MFEKWLCHDPTHQIGMRNALSDVRPRFYRWKADATDSYPPCNRGFGTATIRHRRGFFIFSFPLIYILVQKLRYGLSPNIVFYMHHDTKAIDIQNAREKG